MEFLTLNLSLIIAVFTIIGTIVTAGTWLYRRARDIASAEAKDVRVDMTYKIDTLETAHRNLATDFTHYKANMRAETTSMRQSHDRLDQHINTLMVTMAKMSADIEWVREALTNRRHDD